MNEAPALARTLRVVIVGRPNVGKSTLFNRLLGRRRALVHDLPGVTRDRIEEKANWWVQGKSHAIVLVDTGGLGGDRFSDEIESQVGTALTDADVILLVFDARSGLMPQDRELIQKFNRSGVFERTPVLTVVNKVDADSHEGLIADFFEAGISGTLEEQPLTVSAEHGRGIDDLQEAIVRVTGAAGADEELPPEEPHDRRVHVAIIGQPNVGKSTLVNAILGQERMITSPIAGTTVDAVDSVARIGDREFVLVDTAGIRRKSKTEQGVEVLSVVQAKKALERADVAILLLDGERGIVDQDEKIGSLIEEEGCSVILAINKWDTQEGKTKFTREMAAEHLRKKMAYLRYAPILFLSAKNGEGFENLPDLVDEILEQRRVKIGTREFTEWVKKESAIHNPMNARFYLCHQASRRPPTFVCHVSDSKKVHFSLQRHLVNAMRERWGFMGTPVRLLFVTSAEDSRRRKPTK